MTHVKLSQSAIDALSYAIATKGKNKGKLLARAPASNTLAYAAWQGAMLSVNPYKASICGLMFMTEEQRAISQEVTAFFDANRQLRGMDKDRSSLESLGVW